MYEHLIQLIWFGATTKQTDEQASHFPLCQLSYQEVFSNEVMDAQLCIVEDNCFSGPEELLEKTSHFPVPILFLVEASWLSVILSQLRPQDDVCLKGTPTELLSHRSMRLLSMTPSDTPIISEVVNLDGLTGLLQRRAFNDQFAQFIVDTPSEQSISLLLGDIDRFKNINDCYGHLIGDLLLQEVAKRLQKNTPQDALLARFGGEEFVMVCRFTRGTACELAEHLRRSISEEPFVLLPQGEKPVELEATISFGICTQEAKGATPSSLTKSADTALYAAKAQGRNRVIHIVDFEQEAHEKDSNVKLESFQNMIRVLTDRVGEVIAYRGRRIFDDIQKQAQLDGLTQLYSRGYFDSRLPFEFEMAQNQPEPFTIALLDIDFFGQFNKTYGWPTGDKILVEIAERIKKSLRASDWVARYGGEEICVVMQRTTLQQAMYVMERVQKAIRDDVFYTTGQEPVQITASIGIAEQSRADQTPLELLERASQRLLEAKRTGRDRISI